MGNNKIKAKLDVNSIVHATGKQITKQTLVRQRKYNLCISLRHGMFRFYLANKSFRGR